MNRLYIMLEELFCDICFTGVRDCGELIIRRLEQATVFCRELEMKLCEELVTDLSEKLSQKKLSESADAVSRLGCYVQCLGAVMNEQNDAD